MRLSEWRRAAPNRESMSGRVMGTLEPVLSSLGAGADPYCWVAWGEEPEARYTVLAPTRAGLAHLAVRVNIPGEGPRVNGKLVRWSRLQLSELTMESSGGHRLVALQMEGQVLRGVDDEADAIAEFVRSILAAVDGKEWEAPVAQRGEMPGRAPRAAADSSKPTARRTPRRKTPGQESPKALPSGEPVRTAGTK